MKQFTFRTIIQKDGKGFHGFVPSLPGCHTYGDTIEEIRKNIKEAVKGWIEVTAQQGWDIPSDEGIETIETIQLSISGQKNNFTYA
ncbi:type II toxin-antitoxin system HicB family antitoxin [Patescibacteria group bacterium]|nr:type II toxin-antitoxin system HicB family antitoxin [Patescibacteria group bacterium]